MRARFRTSAAIMAIAIGTLAFTAAGAGAKPFAPPKNKIYAGVSDTGSKSDYFAFTEEIERHVPILQAFEPWGGPLKEARQRWNRTETRGMLSISTSPCYECEELISPGRIKGGHGDGYLIRLNKFLADWDRPVYIRLLPEMNGHWNPYAAFDEDGGQRGRQHKTKQFRKAWRRSVIIVRGGPRWKINRKLGRLGLPRLKRGDKSKSPKHLKRTDVAFLWVPQTHGSPRLKRNRPAAYWPGGRYVDWVGADIYGKFPNFEGLERLYNARKKFPFMIGEWAPWDLDEPAFTNTLHEWVEARRRAKMLVYYQGFGDNNPFMIQRYPSSAKALRRQLDDRRYKRYAPNSERPDRGGKETDPDGGVSPG